MKRPVNEDVKFDRAGQAYVEALDLYIAYLLAELAVMESQRDAVGEQMETLATGLRTIAKAENWVTTTFPNGETECAWKGESWPGKIAANAILEAVGEEPEP